MNPDKIAWPLPALPLIGLAWAWLGALIYRDMKRKARRGDEGQEGSQARGRAVREGAEDSDATLVVREGAQGARAGDGCRDPRGARRGRATANDLAVIL